jgi:hypothetical protein
MQMAVPESEHPADFRIEMLEALAKDLERELAAADSALEHWRKYECAPDSSV